MKSPQSHSSELMGAILHAGHLKTYDALLKVGSSSLLTHIKHLLRSKAPSTTTYSPFLQIFSVKLCLDCFFLFSHLPTVKKRLLLFHSWAPDLLCSLYHLPMLASKHCAEVAYHVNIIFLAFPICRIATETLKLPRVLINV